MSHQSTIAVSAIACTLLAGIALALPAHAANTSCDAVLDAGIKQVQTPHHVHSSSKTSSGKVTSSDAIFVGGVEYLRVGDGNWRRSSMTPKEMLQGAQEKRKQSSADTCRILGDETIAGQAATLYEFRPDGGVASKIWISKSSGLPLRQTLDLGGTLMDVSSDYNNVQAPAGAK